MTACLSAPFVIFKYFLDVQDSVCPQGGRITVKNDKQAGNHALEKVCLGHFIIAFYLKTL